MNKSINDIVENRGRKYVQDRLEIEQKWQFEFDTFENREEMNNAIEICKQEYHIDIRNTKIDHLLNDTIFRK